MASPIIKLIEKNSLPVSKRTRSKNSSILNYSDNLEDKKIYISATEFDNFCENDPISDWFSILAKEFNLEDKYSKSDMQFLFDKGNEHEENIIEKLRKITGLKLEKLSSVKTSREYNKNLKLEKKDIERTLHEMSLGQPILYSSYIYNNKEKLRGIPDLLVRNDYIPIIFNKINHTELPEEKSIFGSYYYVPVEIKFSSVELTSNDKYILNKGRMKIYKTQLFTYCKILEEIQGVLPKKAFIIGKRTVLSKKDILDPIEYPGLIDYTSEYDSCYFYIFHNGLKWLRDVKENGISWSFEDMKSKELYPNMKSSNNQFYKDKKELSEKYGEITELWRCSTLIRKNALNKGIYSWKDQKFNASITGMSKYYHQSLNNILKVNREDIDYYPRFFSDTSFREVESEAFVDFEIIRDSFDIDSYGDSEWIFLIGVRYKGEYKSFIMNSLSEVEEKRVIDEFIKFLSDNNFPKCWFWCAEVKFWNRAMTRHNMKVDNIKWVDLYDIYTKESFAVKGSLNFKLKSYIKNLVKLKKINVDLPPENCSDGLSAMTIAWKYYNDVSNRNEEEMKDVIYYNSLDCQYVEELLNFARNFL
jgi:hypothetical protein